MTVAYTWTGSSALGFDLARRDGGRAVAAVLSRGLAADRRYAAALADLPRAPQRVRLAGVAAMDAAEVDREVELSDGAPGSSNRTLVTVAARVAAIRFGDAADLVDLAGRCLLDTPGIEPDVRNEASGHLRDAVTAALVRAASPTDLTPGVRAVLADQLDAGYRKLDDHPVPQPDLGPGETDILALLGRLADGTGHSDLRRAATRTPADSADWVAAMHGASWAVELSGRTMASAAAQLRLVEALHASGLRAADCAAWAWNAASGMVTGLLVADLLPQRQVANLLRT